MKKAIVPLGILILVIFGVFMYINRFTIFHTSDIDGIIFATNDMATNLAAGINEESPQITFENVKINETIYKSGKKYYIGEETKKNVNLDYPIVSTDTSSLLILNDKGNFVDDSFVKSATYENTILNEGTLYNGVNNSKVSDDKYIFLEVGNGIYVNLVELNVKRDGEDHRIPVNSFIYFEQSFLRFYTMKNGVYKFTELSGIEDKTETLIGETKYEYFDFLVYLGIITPKEDKQEEIIEEILTPEEQKEEIKAETKPPSGIIIPNEPYNPGNNFAEGVYIKPEARIRNTSVNVYSYKGYIEIYDPAQKISKSPTIEFKVGRQVKLRFMYNKSMDFEAVGLEPDTEYEVEAYFLYYGADGQKYKTTFFTESIKTKDMSNLETLKLVVDDVKPGMKTVKLGTLKLNNQKDDEVLKGLKFGKLSFNNIHIQMSQGTVMNLADLKTESYETGESLSTATEYHGIITFQDFAGNDLIVTGNEFDFETLKTPPIAKIGVELSNNFTLAKAKIELTNPDRVEASRYRYALFEYDTQEEIQADSLRAPEDEKNQNVDLINLSAQTKYILRVYCDYIDSENGELIKDYVMADYVFTTFDAERLGTVKFVIEELQTTQNELSIRAKFLQYSATDPVFELMEENLEVVLTNVDVPGEVITYEISKSEFIAGKVIDFVGLTSNTTYELTIGAKISSGCGLNGECSYYYLPTSPDKMGFKTDKAAAVVHVANGFVASKYVDFDVCIEDPDESINREYPVQILFKKVEGGKPGTTVASHEIVPKDSCAATTLDETGAIVNAYEKYDRIIENKDIEADKTYQINIYAQEYNTKHTLNTKTTFNEYINDLKTTGTSGNLKIVGLTNEVNYKLNEDLTCDTMGSTNLFDISNNSRWKVKTNGESKDDKEVKIDDNELILKAYRGYTSYSYYLPELQGRSYSIKYDYEFEQGASGGMMKIITNDSFDGGEGIEAHTATDSGSARHVIVSQVGKYLTFYVKANEDVAKTTSIKMKNIQINCNTSDDSIEYESFGGESNSELYVGEFYAFFEGLMEKNLSEITYPEKFNEKSASEYKYYVNYYVNGEKLEEAEGDTASVDNLLPEEGQESIVQNLIKREIEGNQNLEARLGVSVDINGVTRYYDLKVVKFSSEAETRTIKTAQDFMDMHAYGYYIVDLEDQPNTCTLPENQTGSCISLTGKHYSYIFQGNIDFQGNKVEIITNGTTNYGLFSQIGGGGVVKNIDLHMHMANTVSEGYLADPITTYAGLADANNGTISNVKVSFSGFYQPREFDDKWEYDEDEDKDVLVKEWIVDRAHSGFSLIAKTNSGKIENFLIDMKSELIVQGSTGLVAQTNNGTIKNGYVIGENINAGYSTGTSGVGVIASSSSTNSRISNIYSLVDVVVHPPEYPEGYKIKYNSSQLYKDSEYMVPIENPTVTTNTGAGLVYNASGAFVENAIIIDPRVVYHEYAAYDYETNRNKSQDPVIVYGSYDKCSNLNYIGKDSFSKTYHEVAIASHLKEGEFMEAALNSDGMFNAKEAASIGQLPRLYWDEFMPEQKIIKIPEYTESDRLKILSVNTVTASTASQKFKYDGEEYNTEVKFSIYNPQNFKVVGLELDGFATDDVKIVGRSGINAAKQEMITMYINQPETYRKNYDISEIYINEQTAGNEIGVLTKACFRPEKTVLDSETEFDCNNLPYLTLDLYLEVDSFNEILYEAENNFHENFSLTKDIDYSLPEFASEPTSIDYLGVRIKGNGHTLKNLSSGNCFIKEFSGELIDFNIENYKVEYDNNSGYNNYAGFICNSYGGVIDNVHMKNVELLATPYKGEDWVDEWTEIFMGGIVGYADNMIIKNSSVTNVHLPEINNTIPGAENRSKDYAERAGQMNGGILTIGGLIGYSYNTDLTNSFARKVKFTLNQYEEGVDDEYFTDYKFGFTELFAAGGLAGYFYSGKIENVYATGTIDSKIGSGCAYIGGLVGGTSSKISSALSFVSVYAVTLEEEEGNLGGMIGYTSNAYGNVASKTLVLGDVLTSVKTDNITKYRTSGTPIQANKNFAWFRQAMNSQVSANTSNEELLNDEDLSNPAIYSTKIGLSSKDFTLDLDNYHKVAYDKDDNIYEVSYDTPLKEVEKEEESFDVIDVKTGNTVKVMEVHGTMPKLLHSETGEVLSNQDVALDTVINYVELFSISEIESITYINVDPSADGDASDYTYKDTQEAMKNEENIGVVNYLGRVVEVVAYIKNPNKLPITEIEIEDMDVLNLDIAQTSYNLELYQAKIYAKAKPNKNKDSYNITCIKYRLQGEDMQYRATIKFDVSIYGAINSAADWNGIKKGTYQNFAVIGDVDFNDIPLTEKIATDLTFNELLGIPGDYENADGNSEKRGPVIKNFNNQTRNQIMGSNSSLIAEIKKEVRYLNFDNITLINNSSSSTGTYFGIIKTLTGSMYGRLSTDAVTNEYIDFTNIKIDGKSIDRVGCIAYNNSPYMQYVRAEKVEVSGRNNVGGIIGYSQKKPKYDIYGKSMVVKGYDYVGGLIGYDYNSTTKMLYDIAAIGVHVEGRSYVGGAVGQGTSYQASVIGSDETYNGYALDVVKGTGSNVGGIFGYLYYNSSKFYVENMNITGSSNVGGISGTNYYDLYEASVINTNVTATSSYAGGISGYSVDDIYRVIVAGGTVKATYNNVGGITSYAGSYKVTNSHVGSYNGTPTVISGTYYVGGVVGQSTGYVYNNFTNATITGTYYVGGISGYGTGSKVYSNIVGGSTITSTSTTSSGTITSGSIRPGHAGKSFNMSYLGGVIGRMNGYSFSSYYNVVNATMVAKANGAEIDLNNSSYAGYGYYAGGYINHGYTYQYVYDYSTSPATRVKEYYYYDQSHPKGDGATYFPGQYVDSLKKWSYMSSYGYPQIYEYSTLNGVPVKDNPQHPTLTVDYRNFSKKTASEMRTISGTTYNRISSFEAVSGENTSDLVHYPYPSGLKVRYTDADLFNPLTSEMAYEVSSMADVAGLIQTTTAVSNSNGNTSTGRPDFHVLPDFDVYASDVDKINIEFAETDPYTYIKVNGENYTIKQNTFTFYYDFKEDFVVEIGDGINSKEVTISVDDVKNGITVIGEYYYYLEDGEIITNQPRDLTKEQEEITETPSEENSSNSVEDHIGEIIAEGVAYNSTSPATQIIKSGIGLNYASEKRLDESDTSKLIDNATNIYGEEVLLENQDIYNINTGETKENSFENLTLVDTTKPLYEFIYANQKIQTYYNYSIIDGKYIDKQVYVKNGKLEVVDKNLDSDNSSIIIDSYNNKEFLVYLGNDGKLHSLKDDIEYPKNFKNINIKGISTNLTSNTNMMLVEYKDGSRVVFNYVTGQLVSSHSDEPISLGDYVKQYLEISQDELKKNSTTNAKYEAAKKLAEKLNQMPVEKVLNGENFTGEGALLDQNKYTVVYDPIKKDYYVYEIPSEDDSGQVRLTESLSTSVNSVIDANPILVKYYKGESYSKISVLSSVIITIAVITGIAGAIVYLSKYFKKNKKKEA